MADTFLSVGFGFDPQLKEKEVCVSRSFPKPEKDPRVGRVVFFYVFWVVVVGWFFLQCFGICHSLYGYEANFPCSSVKVSGAVSEQANVSSLSDCHCCFLCLHGYHYDLTICLL